MLEEFLNKLKGKKTPGWGVSGGIFWPLALYIGAQLFGSALAPTYVYLTDSLSQNYQVAIYYLILDTLTLGLIFVIIKLYGQSIFDLGLRKIRLKHVLWAFLGFGIYFLISTVIQVSYSLISGDKLDQTQDIQLSNLVEFEYVLVFFVLVLLVPFVEEIMFRGFMFAGLRKRLKFWPSAIIVSLIFAAIHGQLNVGLDVFALSLVLCYLREHFQSLWPSIMLHAIKNGLAYSILFIFKVV